MEGLLYIKSDDTLANMWPISVMIKAADATALKGGTVPSALVGLPVGSAAYTCGWKEAWQLDVDGETWVQCIGAEADADNDDA